MVGLDSEELEFVIHHLFLPKRLPQECDADPAMDSAFMNLVNESAQVFVRGLPESHPAWEITLRMIKQFNQFYTELDQRSLKRAFLNLNTDDAFVLYLRAQNAGVIFRKPSKDTLTLEYFQASPKSSAVASTTGKLVTQFPFHPRSSMAFNEQGIDSLCALLIMLHTHEFPDTYTTTSKAGKKNREIREVQDIRYVADLLGGIFLGQTSDPELVASSTQWITKRLDDHSLWDNCLLPWRRAPLWLVLRVALQTTLAEHGIAEHDPIGYKAFITFILSRALIAGTSDPKLSDEMLYQMNVKIARRMAKLDRLGPQSSSETYPFNRILDSMRVARQRLDENWGQFQNLHIKGVPWTPPTPEQVEEAQKFDLLTGGAHLEAVMHRPAILASSVPFFDPEAHGKMLCQTDPTSSSTFPAKLDLSASDEELWVVLDALETWVGLGNLQPGVSSGWFMHTAGSSRVDPLVGYLSQLHELVQRFRNDQPERFSRIFLLLLEFWVSLDDAVTSDIPLLKDYSPEISVSSLEPLLLPGKTQMERLVKVEKHLLARHQSATSARHSVFRFKQDSQSFAARFFCTSSSLQALRDAIVQAATRKRAQKVTELHELSERYSTLKREVQSLSCEYYNYLNRWDELVSQHSRSCLRCAKNAEANSMGIKVFEWPLPENDTLEHMVVFELCPPWSFALWRDETYKILRRFDDLFKAPSGDLNHLLVSYSELGSYFSGDTNYRLTIGSCNAKSHLVTHWKAISFPTSLEEVVKPNGLRYEMRDTSLDEWLFGPVFPEISIRGYCTPSPLPGPYKNAWGFIQSTAHTPNQVLASQSDAHRELPLEEYIAFGNLRAELVLQLRNIARGLAVDKAALSKPAVYLLYRQALWQAEARDSAGAVTREAHSDLADSSFANKLLELMECRLDSVRANWQEAWVLTLLSTLAGRILDLSIDSSIVDRCLAVLAEIRLVVMIFLGQINKLLNSVSTSSSPVDIQETSRADLHLRLAHLAATGRSTFAATNSLMLQLANLSAVEQLLYFSLIISNNIGAGPSSFAQPYRDIIERDVCISAAIFPYVSSAVKIYPQALDWAIHRFWDGFKRDALSPWAPVGTRWITCRTSSEGGSQVRSVYYNLLKGQLQVDGKALDTLPTSYVRNSLYQFLFPNRNLVEIAPSRMKGMEYELRQKMWDYEVHFAFKGSMLLVRLRDSEQQTSEFIPSSVFVEDFPQVALNDSILLYRDNTQTVDIFPSSTTGWKGDATPEWQYSASNHSLFRTSSPTEVALSPRSHVVTSISHQVGSIECTPHLLLIFLSERVLSTTFAHFKFSNRHLLINLPRYGLSFFLDGRKELASREFPHYAISPQSDLGTLVGLCSKLVLQSGDSLRAIVPFSPSSVTPSWESSQPAASVTINLPSNQRRIRSLVLDVDTILGRLSCQDKTLSAHFFLAYLHLVTSSHLPDPLSGSTGLEIAMSMLLGARSLSFMDIDVDSSIVLKNIHKCTPIRTYYPKHLQCMENVVWRTDMPSLVQEDQLARPLWRVASYAESLSVFGSRKLAVDAANQSSVLVDRAVRRAIRTYNTDETVPSEEAGTDQIYVTHHGSRVSQKDISCLSAGANHWLLTSETNVDIWGMYSQWEAFSSICTSPPSVNSFLSWFTDSEAGVWFSFNHLRSARIVSFDVRTKVAFLLPVVAYRGPSGLRLAHLLLLMATNAPRALDDIPRASFKLGDGITLTSSVAKSWGVGDSTIQPFEASRFAVLQRLPDETKRQHHKRRQEAYDSALTSQRQKIVDTILFAWPAPTISWERLDPRGADLLNFDSLKRHINPKYKSVHLNHLLHSHAKALQRVLERHNKVSYAYPARTAVAPPVEIPTPRNHSYTLLRLMQQRHPPSPSVSAPAIKVQPYCVDNFASPSSKLNELQNFLGRLRELQSCNGVLLRRYTKDLASGISCLEKLGDCSFRGQISSTNYQSPSLDLLCPGSTLSDISLSLAAIFPSSSVRNLLEQLRLLAQTDPTQNPELSLWKTSLTTYASELLLYQRQSRILRLQMVCSPEAVKEQANFPDGESLTNIDWLLCQLDSNITIREVQRSIAMDMMDPPERSNSLRQLNMGEGKTSVIMPLISASLANGQSLVRVVVLKPLARQSFDLLVERLSGLTNRRIFFLPFSRDVPVTPSTAAHVARLMRCCQEERGILLCQPEHLLSFHLMTIHFFCSHGPSDPVTSQLLETAKWLHLHARDILDESDELLKVKYQLIYTIGSSRGLSGQPGRWELIQEVATVLLRHLKKCDPNKVEMICRKEPNAFPRTRILEKGHGEELLHAVARSIVYDDVLGVVSFRTLANDSRDQVYRYITEKEIDSSTESVVFVACEPVLEYVLVLRGLFSHGLLLHAFGDKRYRVDYGLHPTRTPLAVPYRSKDQPALRAEFGHPDVTILLSLLSYYYGGLNDQQLNTCFEGLYKSDNPALRYEDWIKDVKPSLPLSLHSLKGLNLADINQKLTVTFPLLRFNKNVIDFYVAQTVFPKIREFAHKLSTNAWDLSMTKERLVTGFSGTQDNKYLLPTTIQQARSRAQQHTDALVLSHLLLPRNSEVVLTEGDSALSILFRVRHHGSSPSVLLDCGAQILELDNFEVAQSWLKIDQRPQYEAAVYFAGTTDKAHVLHRDGHQESFEQSLYRSQLDKCLIYLDEAHTRGTDFKFSPKTVAVVTLGPGMTKDKLAQGCMRMRRLAEDHSVVMFCPGEVEMKIREALSLDSNVLLKSEDVLLWTISETCRQIETSMHLWKHQGLNFDMRHEAFRGYLQGEIEYDEARDRLLEPEALTLKQMYGLPEVSGDDSGPQTGCQAEIFRRFEEFNLSTTDDPGTMVEEQERELAHEKEVEREVERAGPAKPMSHAYDRDLEMFVQAGVVGHHWITLEDCLANTSAAEEIPSKFWTTREILATKDFRNTIVLGRTIDKGAMTNFIRPVQWIVSSEFHRNVVVLISPHEANELLRYMRSNSKRVGGFLHLYAPRVSRSVDSLEDLDFVTFPNARAPALSIHRSIIHRLNLFSAQLFFKDKASFEEVSKMLGLCLGKVPQNLRGKVDADGFSPHMEGCMLDKSAVKFLRELIASRRKGQGFTLTHMGNLLYGRNLDENEF